MTLQAKRIVIAILGILGSSVLSIIFFIIGMQRGLDEMLPFAPLPLIVAVPVAVLKAAMSRNLGREA